MMFWKRHRLEPPNPDVIEVDLLPCCDFCQQQYPANHVLYQAAWWYGRTQIGPEASMCQAHYLAYGITGKSQRIIKRERTNETHTT